MEASDAKADKADPGDPGVTRILYRNHRGEVAVRRIRPLAGYVGASEWHPGRQLLLEAWDLDRGATRAFAWKDILEVNVPDDPGWAPAAERAASLERRALVAEAMLRAAEPLPELIPMDELVRRLAHRVMAAEATRLFEMTAAEHWVCLKAAHPETGEAFYATVRREGGEMPEDTASRLRLDVQRLEAENAQLREALRRLHADGR